MTDTKSQPPQKPGAGETKPDIPGPPPKDRTLPGGDLPGDTANPTPTKPDPNKGDTSNVTPTK